MEHPEHLRMDYESLRQSRLERIDSISCFEEIILETTNFCNLRCKFCLNHKMKRKRGFLSDKTFEILIKKIKSTGLQLNVFAFAMIGEPLLHPRIGDYVKRVKEENITRSISLTTNGVALSEKVATALIEGGLDRINISINAATEETYKEQVGRDVLDEVEANIGGLLRVKANLGSMLKVVVRMVENPGNQKEIEVFTKKWKNCVDWVSVYRQVNWGGGLDSLRTNGSASRIPCLFIWNTLPVYWDGRIPLCCMDAEGEMVFGSIYEHGIRELYETSSREVLKKYHLDGAYEKMLLCKDCDHELTDCASIGQRL